MFDWDDLRVFIATARAGSSAKAARALGVDASTMNRRIAGLEARSRPCCSPGPRPACN